uniref:Uncharacterized protein n=1 Tax=Rhizophora mucronata TaxID=61149 RepID=A0A2P2R062_RHIMU
MKSALRVFSEFPTHTSFSYCSNVVCPSRYFSR